MKTNSSELDDSVGLAQLVDRITLDLVSGKHVNLDQACERHPKHAQQLRSLIPAINAVANLSGTNGNESNLNEKPIEDRTIGDFHIQREIGRGGMGVVYEAKQLSLSRRVALKVLPFASLFDEKQLLRFKNEARAAASLRHPNIVTVHGVGSDRGVHYYAMDLIEGSDLATAIRRIHHSGAANNESPDGSHKDEAQLVKLSSERGSKQSSFFRSVTKLAIQAADALQHAHSTGVVHRDIKPANLLLDKNGLLQITDFGLAHVAAHDELSVTNSLIGTLRYMSPEQIEGEEQVDARSDVYSLGLTIYELLAGVPANAGESRADLLRNVADPSPKELKHLIAGIPQDLQTIIDTAISPNPKDRYQSAGELSQDLNAFLGLRSIKAKPSTQLSRLHRFAKRNPSLAIAFTVTLASTIFIAILTSLWASDAAQQTAAANEATRAQRLSLYAADMRAAKEFKNARRLVQLQETLLRWVPDANESDLRQFEWYHLWQYCEDPSVVRTFNHELPGSQVRFLDNEHIVMLGFSSRGKVFSLAQSDARPKKLLQSPATNLDALAFHAKTDQIAVGDGGGNVTTWDWRTGNKLFETTANAGEGENNSSETLDFNSDGSKVLLGGGSWQKGFVRLWELPNKIPILRVSRRGEACAAFGPNDNVIVSSYREGHLSVFEQGQWNTPQTVKLKADGVWRIAISEDRSLFAVGAYRQHDQFKTWQIQVYETSSWNQVWAFDLPSTPDTIGFTGEPRLLAWGDEAGTAWLARLEPEKQTAKIKLRKKLHDGAVSGIDISPSGKYLATSGWDGHTTVWNLELVKKSHPAEVSYAGQDFWPSGAQFTAVDSKIAAVAVRYEGVFLWNSETGEVVSKLPIDVGEATNLQVSASHSGKICVSMGMWPSPKDKAAQSRVVFHDLATGDSEEILVPAVGISLSSNSMFPNGDYCAICSYHAGVIVIKISNGLQRMLTLPSIQGKSIRSSADNKTIAVGGTDGIAYLLTAPNFECVERIRMDERLIDSIDISSDGNLVAAVGFDRRIKLYDRNTGTLREFAKELPSFPNLVRLSPCGTRIMTGSLDGMYRLWTLDPGEVVQRWPCRPFGWPVGEFSSDGSTFLANGVDFANALHAPRVDDLRLLPASTLRSRACKKVSSVDW